MSLHVNPLQALQNGNGVIVTPEVMVLYAENSDVFEYIREIVGDWEYYVSETIELDATAYVTVQAGEFSETQESKCKAYIYGWTPGSTEWINGSCVAIVFFTVPTLVVSESPTNVTVAVCLESEEAIIFNSKRTIPVLYEAAAEE